jgi:ADP-ribosyl-[dinitrogen reductase] hydrolase
VDGLRDRASACLLGLALGDALGAPFEFRRADEIPDPIPAFELPWNGSPPGTWTDDTAMALNLVGSLADRGIFDAGDVVTRHVAWLEAGPPDVGNQTRAALVGADPRLPPGESARRVWERRGPEVSAGNGSVMYCAPLGAFRAREPQRLVDEAPTLSAITHWDGRCRTACLAVTLATAALVRGEPAEPAVRTALDAVLEREGGEELEYLTAEAGRARPVDGPDQGFCFFAAGLALRTAAEASSFEVGLRAAVALGGDTDTNAAVAGALLGARDGAAGLPGAWLDRLASRETIERHAVRLGDLAVRG